MDSGGCFEDLKRESLAVWASDAATHIASALRALLREKRDTHDVQEGSTKAIAALDWLHLAVTRSPRLEEMDAHLFLKPLGDFLATAGLDAAQLSSVREHLQHFSNGCLLPASDDARLIAALTRFSDHLMDFVGRELCDIHDTAPIHPDDEPPPHEALA